MPHPHPTQQHGITDLTLIAAIKPGLVDGILDSRSHAWRLHSVLRLLDTVRRSRTEIDLVPSPFADAVERLRGIHFFRFAVLPQQDRLLLNVTFDGGWEPYMRQIWGPLGTLLDLIFCHCTGYPLAATSRFEDYAGWVRENEVPSQFFYADSPATVADRAYLAQLEAHQRAAGATPDADRRAARLTLRRAPDPQPTPEAALAALRMLKGLHALTALFGRPRPSADGGPEPDDGSVLHRFAQDFLPTLLDWKQRGLFQPGQPLADLGTPFAAELKWLGETRWSRPKPVDRALPDRSQIQSGILRAPKPPAGRFGRGALVLVRVASAAAARVWLRSMVDDGRIADDRTETLADDRVTCTVALTCAGLRALGLPESQLQQLPAEFVQGMEARAGILGDVRHNHPSRWRPPRPWRSGVRSAPIDLRLVHLLLQLRTAETAAEAAPDRSALLPRLAQWIAGVPAALEVLAVEAGWSRPAAAGEAAARDHFGFVDGLSQPALAADPGRLHGDEVATGELLLGWPNERGDGPSEWPDGGPVRPPWLDCGTFMVVRKIRQHVEVLDAIVEHAAAVVVEAGAAGSMAQAREEVRARLLGRRSDGRPLVAVAPGAGSNEFDYAADVDGSQCPFASHVRRANPRDGSARSPRIARRGMSYGPVDAAAAPAGAERGMLFIACNASIAEQFEVIQRWLTGGNSSGVSSSQADPFLGVPRAGESRIFPFVIGERLVRVDLGDRPASSLAWGLYAFVPSIALLRGLDQLRAEPGRPQAVPGQPGRPTETPAQTLQRVKLEFEDELGRRARWKRLRDEQSGVTRIGTSVMVGARGPLLQVLRDPGDRYSVVGYGERMRATLGGSPFGQDDVGPHGGHQRGFVAAVKQAVAGALTESQACDAAYRFVAEHLAAVLATAGSAAMQRPGLPIAAPVEIQAVGVQLIAELCRQWFGVAYAPGGFEAGGPTTQALPVRCPGHLMTASRFVFSADPNPTVKALTEEQAGSLRQALAGWAAAPRAAVSAPVTRAVLDAIDHSRDKIDDEERVGTLANVMFGLPGTLFGSWVKVLLAWSASGELWALQHALALALPHGQPVDHAHADRCLRDALIATMAADPVADGIWRTVVKPGHLHGVAVETGDLVRLGIGSALADSTGDRQTAEALLFGGPWRSASAPDAVHACPGRGLAIGALLGALAAWLTAGRWSTTTGPTTLMLEAFD